MSSPTPCEIRHAELLIRMYSDCDANQLAKRAKFCKSLQEGRLGAECVHIAVQEIDDLRERLHECLLRLERKKYDEEEKHALRHLNLANDAVAQVLARFLFKDPVIPGERLYHWSMAYQAKATYGLEPMKEDDNHSMEKEENYYLWDIVYGCPASYDLSVFALVPSKVPPAVIDFVCGAGSASRLETWENCLIIPGELINAFEDGNAVIVPVDLEEDPIMRWKIMVYPSAKHYTFIDASIRTWQQRHGSDEDPQDLRCRYLDGRELKFRTNSRPAVKFLYFRYLMSMVLYSTEWTLAEAGHCDILKELKHPWITKQPYLRNSFLLQIAQEIGANDQNLVAATQESFGGVPQRGDDSAERPLARNAFWLAMGRGKDEINDRKWVDTDSESDTGELWDGERPWPE